MQKAADNDFMSIDYQLNQEPLFLGAEGQAWFESIYDFYNSGPNERALILGAVAWMARLLAKNSRQIDVVDHSQEMLGTMQRTTPQASAPRINFVCAEWEQMASGGPKLDVVLGDNSFTFLKYPESWRSLSRLLAGEMSENGLLLLRAFSAPEGHELLTVEELTASYQNASDINYTEVRARLLFSQWDPKTYTIVPRDVLEVFNRNRARFDDLLGRASAASHNDLETIRKYRNCDAVYSAPPLQKMIQILGESFDILGVHFGPYPMSQYFPLIVARKRS